MDLKKWKFFFGKGKVCSFFVLQQSNAKESVCDLLDRKQASEDLKTISMYRVETFACFQRG